MSLVQFKVVRILIGVVAPLVTASILLALWYTVFEEKAPSLITFFKNLTLILIVAFGFVWFQSLLYSLTMEYLVLKHTKKITNTLPVSGLLGVFVSQMIFIEDLFFSFDPTFLLIGLTSGLVAGYVLTKIASGSNSEN